MVTIEQMSPLNRAWEDFRLGKPTRDTFTDAVREAFNAGHQAGIAFALSQIQWDVENAAGHNNE